MGQDSSKGIPGTLQAPKEAPSGAKRGIQDPMVLIAIVAVLFLGFVLPRLRRRRASSPSDSPGTFEPAARNARDELDRLLTDIQDISREQIARLDTKIRLLNQLLLECDQKQRALESLLARAPLEPVPADPSPVQAPTPPHRPANPLHDQVYTLQDSGRDLQDICSATGLEKGEVELILGLRQVPPAAR